MTLPFRRRHHDDESAHDRARATWSTAMLEEIEPADQAWLDIHLTGCGDCRLEREAQLGDHLLLRSLRDQPIEPPRDLWARTAAAIEHESGRRSRGRQPMAPIADRLFPRPVRLPVGAIAGLLVAIVVIATSLAPRGIVQVGPTPAGSGVAEASPLAVPSPIAVKTAPLGWIQGGPDGSYQLLLADVDQVCPNPSSGCAPLSVADKNRSSVQLGAKPDAIVGSPNNSQIVVVSGASGSGAGSVIVVPVPTPATGASAAPTGSGRPTAPVSPTAPATPTGSPGSTPIATPIGARSIAEGVTVVGETAYSPNGKWLAFSARPLDGSTGPDLYLWNTSEPHAIAITVDHETYFSGWYGQRILASRVVTEQAASPAGAVPVASGSPAASVDPTAEQHPMSFLVDPATGVSVDLSIPDVWLPTVDTSGRFAAYWLGTVRPNGKGTGWLPATGRLVLDGWSLPLGAPTSSHDPKGGPGPAGTAVDLVDGPVAAFEARFDPSGSRLAVWVADPADATVGTLQLFVLDRGRGNINPKLKPLPSVRALRGISIDQGRLAWVTPPGQDGQQSVVQVLAWSNDDFGQIETIPADQLYLVR